MIDENTTRDYFRKIGTIRVFIVVTIFIILLLGLTEILTPERSISEFLLVGFSFLFVIVIYVNQHLNESLPGALIKITSCARGGSECAEIHQKTRSMFLLIALNIMARAGIDRSIKKTALSRLLLNQCIDTVAYAMNERGLRVVYIKSHLLNNTKARNTLRELIGKRCLDVEFMEGSAKLSFPVRVLLKFTLKRKLKQIPKTMSTLEIRRISK